MTDSATGQVWPEAVGKPNLVWMLGSRRLPVLARFGGVVSRRCAKAENALWSLRFTVGLAAGKKQALQAPCRGQRSLGCAASAAPCSNGTSARELPPEHKHASPRPRSCNPLRSPPSAAFCPQDTARRPASAEAHPRQRRGNAQKKVRYRARDPLCMHTAHGS